MSRVIKSNRLVISSPVELGVLESPHTSTDPALVIAETEEIVRSLLQKADKKASEIIGQAKAEAMELLASAAEEAEEQKEQAYQKGYRDGKEIAEKETEARRQQILAEASQLLDEAMRKKDNYLLEVKEELVQLAVEMAQKIICRQITLQPDTIAEIVNYVFGEANPDKRDRVVIQVAPASLPALTEAFHGNKISWPADRLEVEANPDLTKGSCVIIAPGGTYQVIIEEAIEKLKEMLLGAEIYE